MKIIGKTIIPLFLTIVMLASCNGFPPVPKTQPTQVMETALAIVGTAIAETQTAIPTATSTATMLPSATPLPTFSPLPPTETPTPIKTSIPISGTPTVIPLENGLTWLECVVPNGRYSHEANDISIVTSCINFPHWDVYDTRISGERIKGENGSDLRLVIGQDSFLAKHDSTNGCCDYKFLKNGKVLMEISAPLITFDPNRNLWNIGEKSVWELIADPPVIIVDGVNFNEKYQWEGSFIPYEIKGKLIYIAKKNGKYHIVYDDKVIGSEFDEIQMAFCCSMLSVYHGSEQYWFLAQRAGTQYVVLIR